MADAIGAMIVNQLATLPYWGAYKSWADHFAVDCGACGAVMDPEQGGTGMVEDLCTLGRSLATAANWAVDDQRVKAALN
jgi:hypothetical protein